MNQSLFAELAKKRHTIIREHASKSSEFRDALLEKAAAAERGGALHLNKSKEEVEEALMKVDATLQEVEDKLSSHLPGI